MKDESGTMYFILKSCEQNTHYQIKYIEDFDVNEEKENTSWNGQDEEVIIVENYGTNVGRFNEMHLDI